MPLSSRRATSNPESRKTRIMRSFSVETGVRWRAERLAKFVAHWGIGTLRQLRGRDAMLADDPSETPAGSSARPLPIP